MHKGLSSLQLAALAHSDVKLSQQFGGVFPSDYIPKITKYPIGFIFNNQPSTKAGMHWVAFYFPSKHESEFFDSYGLRPSNYSKNFTTFINKRHLDINEISLQSLNTAVCGDYSLFFLWSRVRGKSIEEIDKIFTKNTINNDKFVLHFVRKYLKIKPHIKNKKIYQIHQKSKKKRHIHKNL